MGERIGWGVPRICFSKFVELCAQRTCLTSVTQAFCPLLAAWMANVRRVIVYPKTVRVRVSATDATESNVRLTHRPDAETKRDNHKNRVTDCNT